MKKNALISVFDKTGIVDFAKKLVDLDYNIISTGGTYRLLKEEGLNPVEVSSITEFPEMLNGRVKTLHPRIHAGILYRRDMEDDVATLEKMEISSIDMVVNSLYPFEEMLALDKDEATMIENIDIGGPSMIRAAAKNFKDVVIVVDNKDYDEIIQRLEEDKLDLDFRKKLAGKAFSLTAYYDGVISSYFNEINGIDFPEYMARPFKLESKLRYGENPHQASSYYLDGYLRNDRKFDFQQLHGKEISFNNMNDLTGAVMSLKEFDEPTVVGVKHTNPSGIGSADNIDDAFDKMIACDDISIFGGIIASNRPVTIHMAEVINSMFMEIVIAPDFDEKAFEILTRKKNLRLIKSENIVKTKWQDLKFKDVMNGVVVQEKDDLLFKEEDFKVVSKRQPSQEEIDNMIFGMKAIKNANSNGVVLVKDNGTIGYGFGEVRRSWAVEKAIERAGNRIDGCVLASDAFFFEDTVELLHENGVKAAISPGGSIHDKDVIELCDKYDIALVFTSTRHFKH